MAFSSFLIKLIICTLHHRVHPLLSERSNKTVFPANYSWMKSVSPDICTSHLYCTRDSQMNANQCQCALHFQEGPSLEQDGFKEQTYPLLHLPSQWWKLLVYWQHHKWGQAHKQTHCHCLDNSHRTAEGSLKEWKKKKKQNTKAALLRMSGL